MNLLFIPIALFVLAAMCWLIAKSLRRRSGLPDGDIVYEDTSGTNSEVLFSAKHRLRGKPDYLLEDADGLVPVEVKSSAAPRNGKPYPSHLMQLAVYFLLVEEVLKEEAPYGLLRYRDRTLRVENTDELREELLDVIEKMRSILREGEAHRNHNQTRRCAGCSVASSCDERLT
jgi:CRISPR-associated exonuclease Cas4